MRITGTEVRAAATSADPVTIVSSATDRPALWRALRHLSNSLRDGHLRFTPAGTDELQSRVRLPFQLVNAGSSAHPRFMISGSERVRGIAPGDELLTYDGVPSAELVQHFRFELNAATPGARLDQLLSWSAIRRQRTYLSVMAKGHVLLRMVAPWLGGVLCSLVPINCTCTGEGPIPSVNESSYDGGPRSAHRDGGADAAANESCAKDADCESDFCDLGVCAAPTPRDAPPGLATGYGASCEEPGSIIGPYGTSFNTTLYCGVNYMCLDGRCRSCPSASQCYDVMGLLACSATDGRPGRQCGLKPGAGEALFTPPDLPLRDGRPLDPVLQEAGSSSALHLALAPSDSVAADAHVAVVYWHQRPGETDEFMQLAYDAPIAALVTAAGELTIPFDTLSVPTSENLICFRGCRDRAICECDGLSEIAVGSVLVAIDTNHDGALSYDELRREQVGVTDVFVGWARVHQSGTPRGFGFVQGPILQGFAAYAKEPNVPLTPLDAQAAPRELSLCAVGDASCLLPVNHILCFRDCDRDWGLDRLGLSGWPSQ